MGLEYLHIDAEKSTTPIDRYTYMTVPRVRVWDITEKERPHMSHADAAWTSCNMLQPLGLTAGRPIVMVVQLS